MEKMKELHPDSHIGALDLEDFKAQILATNKKLDAIERKIQGGDGKASRRVSVDYRFPNPAAVQNDSIYPMPAAKGHGEPDKLLRAVPLEILLHVLKVRC